MFHFGDWRGNLLAQGTNVYTWGAANRLVGANVNGVVSSFEYDGSGNRTAQTVGGVTTEYVLDVGGGLPEVIVATTGGASTRYVQLQGQVLAQQNSGAWTYILPDHLGSVRQLVGSDSQVALAQSYDPFGVPLESAGSGASEFGYTGEWWDAEAGLLYLRARYYDPYLNRFISQDPFLGDFHQPQTLNGWVYADGNPISYVDPAGTTPLDPSLERLRQRAEHCFEAGDLECVWRQYWWLTVGGALRNYSHAAANMHRFLYKLGDVEYGPTSEYTAWVRSSPAVQETKAQLEKDLPAFVHNQANRDEKKGHTKTQFLPVEADPETEVDLYYAMYRFSLWAEADYEVDQSPSCNYDVTIRPAYHFTDDYNWHEGLQAGGVLPGVAGFEDEWSAALHDVGLAKEFKIHGYWKERTIVYTYPSNWFDLDLLPPPISIKPGVR